MEQAADQYEASVVESLLGARNAFLEIRVNMQEMGKAAGVPVRFPFFSFDLGNKVLKCAQKKAFCVTICNKKLLCKSPYEKYIPKFFFDL